MAEDCTESARAAGVCRRRSLSYLRAPDVDDTGVGAAACHSRAVAPRIRGGLCEEECRTDAHRALRLHAQSAVPGVDVDCGGLRSRCRTMVAGGAAGCDVPRDLSADDSVGRGVSTW